MTPQKVYTVRQALERAMKYCVYQERCQQEVRNKLRKFNLTPDEINEVIAELIEQNFLNEERYSKTFARGKFRIKNWGRRKIEQVLQQKQISNTCIILGLNEIPENEYKEILAKQTSKSWYKYRDEQNHQRAAKTANYLIGRGFEPELVWNEIKKHTND